MLGKKLVVLDLDGTLIESVNLHVRAIKEAIRSVIGIEPPEKKIRELIGIPIIPLLKEVLSSMNVEFNDEILERIAELKERLTLENLHEVKLVPGVREALEEWNKRGYVLVCWTASDRDFAEGALRAKDIRKYIKAVVSADDFRPPKPHPAGLRAIMKLFGHSPLTTVLVGDTEYDEEAAKKLGVKAYIRGRDWKDMRELLNEI